jgi:hypothetical protein
LYWRQQRDADQLMQLSRRLSKLHPDKVLGTLQQHIESGHEQAALQAIPELQLRHPGFHNELERIKQQLSDKLLDDVKVLNRDRAVVFRCLNCGSGLAKQSPETVHVICHYCGCDAQHPANDIALERWNNSIDLEANFTIGDFFTFEGKRWQAVGVQLFSGRVREYDNEDGWESSYSRYTSWWMLNEQRELAWLIDDGKRRYWSQKYIPHEPELPDDKNKQFEHGSWTLEFAAGEFSYQPLQGEKHLSAESTRRRPMPESADGASQHSYYTSVESRLYDGEISEIEFFRSRMLPHETVLEGLNKATELTESQRWKRTVRSLLVALPLLGAAFLYFDRGGDRISQTVALTSADTEVPMQQLQLQATEQGQVYKLQGSVRSLRNNSWFGVDVLLLDSDDEEVYSKYLEFWRESGVDSDGAWSEAKRNISWFVRMDQPDTYRVMIDGDAESTTTNTDFTLTAEPNRVSTMPFIIGAVFTLLLVMLSRSKASSIRASGSSVGLRLNKNAGKAQAAASGQRANRKQHGDTR